MSAAQKSECRAAPRHIATKNKLSAADFIAFNRIKQAIQTIAFTMLVNMPMLSILIGGGAA